MSYGTDFVDSVSAGGVLCRPHPARCQSRRPAGAGANQVRNGSQLKAAKALGLTCRPRCSCAPTR